jgi:hypothetical protein
MKANSRKRATAALGSLVLISMIMLWWDPYTHGQVGGEYAIFTRDFDRVPIHRWQIIVSAFQILMLTAAFVQFCRGSDRDAFGAVCMEIGLFLLTNAVYILRDGLTTRATIGDEGMTDPAVVTLVGFVCRIAIIVVLRQCREPSDM